MFIRVLYIASTAVVLAGIGSARGRDLFFVNERSPSVVARAALRTPITQGDVMCFLDGASMPELGPTSAPEMDSSHGAADQGLPGGAVDAWAAPPCIAEVDALPRGRDRPFEPVTRILPGRIMFGVTFVS
ncbi:MAG: hypothetical protein VXZ39_10045 [Planctomycetota bacterium]|nr:hypothetical protein [Planctomycetota bacterium]MEC8495255.1 hypothetical protein [Planctomycetota bacterium]MEC8511490.1 hypothetical protein [Planctomycetota bacterium]